MLKSSPSVGSGCAIVGRHQRSAVWIQPSAKFIFYQQYWSCLEKTKIKHKKNRPRGSGSASVGRHQRSAVRIQPSAKFIFNQLYWSCLEKTKIKQKKINPSRHFWELETRRKNHHLWSDWFGEFEPRIHLSQFAVLFIFTQKVSKLPTAADVINMF